MKNKYYCIDCKKEVSNYRTKRCHSCESKRRHKIGIFNSKGKNNPNYKHGKTNNNRCIDCNTKLSKVSYFQNSKRCKSCARIYQYKTKPETHPQLGKTGKKAPNWKNARPTCKDCDCKINYGNYERCKSCWHKYNRGKNHVYYGKKKSLETIAKRIKAVKENGSLKYQNNPNWRGGKSFEKYTLLFTEELKESIRKRDNYICQKCNNKSTKSKLHIHHIDYNKKNCNENNLISLCMKCHMKTNWNRKYWKKYFKKLTNIK